MSSHECTETDYLVVGQGIAGTMLAYTLMKAGKKVMVIDRGRDTASEIAGGIINPVTGKRMVRSWKAEELLAYAREAYKDMEEMLGISFLREVIICRYLTNPEDKAFCEQQQDKDWFQRNVHALEYDHPGIKNTMGGVAINPALRVYTREMLQAFRHHLEDKDWLREEDFNHSSLNFTSAGVRYKDIKADMAIFCEGTGVHRNPWFHWLPFNPSKGEILIARIPDLVPDEHFIPMKGLYFIPLEKDVFYVGSTNEWNFCDNKPSAHKREEIERKMQKILNYDYEILDHKAATRPAVKDRRPLIGVHPQYRQLAVFNGMGTKGFSLSPYFAREFVNHLLNGDPFDDEAKIERYEEAIKEGTRPEN